MDDLRTRIIVTFDDYLASSGLSARALGLQAASSERFVRRLRRETSVRLSTVERALAWVSAHPPDCESASE